MIVSANLAAFSLAPWFSLEAVYKKAYFKVSSQHPTYCVYCAAGSTVGKEGVAKLPLLPGFGLYCLYCCHVAAFNCQTFTFILPSVAILSHC